MNQEGAQAILDKIIGQIFGYKNPMTVQQFQEKFAFDIRLPIQVADSTTGKAAWTQSPNPTKFITVENAWKREDWDDRPKKPLSTMEEIMAAWAEINYTAVNRQIDSLNIGESDGIYAAENVYRSQDTGRGKNYLFCDGVYDSEYIAAGQRSQFSNYCARIEDSKNSSNSFSVIWSQKIVNSLFIEDCNDMFECMFCSHITAKKFYICNMPFEEAEYRKIKDMVVRWVLTS